MRPVRVALGDGVRPWSAEVQYVFRTLLRIAGYPCEFVAAADVTRPEAVDLYYGPPADRFSAGITITASHRPFADLADIEPKRLRADAGLQFLEFDDEQAGVLRTRSGGLRFTSDLVLACFWLLTGAREPRYPRDRWDNLSLEGSFFLEHDLASKPLVSIYGAFLRRWFAERGLQPRPLPWAAGERCAFAFSHDVDYPEMIRWIECLRLLGSRGIRSVGSIKGVLAGRNHFWKFSDWIDFESRLGVMPAFYFMGRAGSLLEYAVGTPDAFYDIRTKRFRQLFRLLADSGCEIGLHASYHSHRDIERLRAEKLVVEQNAAVAVEGNRHHYWHLDPAAPNETLLRHEQAGLQYDSSLAFEFYPGFRRGICHPFRVFHVGLRRELEIVQLPPAWMDDHFDRRMTQNRIVDPATYASNLMAAAARTGGVTVVDYHVRGMNADFYPRYGKWLMEFIARHQPGACVYLQPRDMVRLYREYETQLTKQSADFSSSNGDDGMAVA